jgi:hypothetical protein
MGGRKEKKGEERLTKERASRANHGPEGRAAIHFVGQCYYVLQENRKSLYFLPG